MKKLLLLFMLSLLGVSIANAATIKFANDTGYPISAKIFVVGGSSVTVNIPIGESEKSFSGCWVGVNFNSFQGDAGTIRGTRKLSDKTLGIQMTCKLTAIKLSLSNNQLKAD